MHSLKLTIDIPYSACQMQYHVIGGAFYLEQFQRTCVITRSYKLGRTALKQGQRAENRTKLMAIHLIHNLLVITIQSAKMAKPTGRHRVSGEGRQEKKYRQQPYDYDFKPNVVNYYTTVGIKATIAWFFSG